MNIESAPQPDNPQQEEKVDQEKKFYEAYLDYLQKYKAEALEALIEIHKYNPKYIFLTETSSIGSGYVMKSGLKAAYPDTEQPEFYRVNPRDILKVMLIGQTRLLGQNIEGIRKIHPTHIPRIKKDVNDYLRNAGGYDEKLFESKRQELETFFRSRIKDTSAKILVFDSDWSTGKSPGSIVSLLKNPEHYGFSADIKCENVKMNLPEVPTAHWNRLKTADLVYGGKVQLDLNLGPEDIIGIPAVIAPLSGVSNNIPITAKNKEFTGAGTRNFRAKIAKLTTDNIKQVHSPVRGTVPLNAPLITINALEQFGIKIGNEIRQDLEKEQQTTP